MDATADRQHVHHGHRAHMSTVRSKAAGQRTSTSVRRRARQARSEECLRPGEGAAMRNFLEHNPRFLEKGTTRQQEELKESTAAKATRTLHTLKENTHLSSHPASPLGTTHEQQRLPPMPFEAFTLCSIVSLVVVVVTRAEVR